MRIDQRTARYLAAVMAAVEPAGEAARPLLLGATCPECGERPGASDDTHVVTEVNGRTGVLIGCEGYWVVPPTHVGIDSPNWQSCGQIDLNEVARLLRDEHGIDNAYVEHTGGGCATVYAGPVRVDNNGDPRYAASAGPGQFMDSEGPNANPDDFYIGPDDDGNSEAFIWGGGNDAGDIAAAIAAFLAAEAVSVSLVHPARGTYLITWTEVARHRALVGQAKLAELLRTTTADLLLRYPKDIDHDDELADALAELDPDVTYDYSNRRDIEVSRFPPAT